MGSNFEDEFRPVDDLLNSGHRTKGVDAFTLTYLRVERQIRKIFTHLIFQSEAFGHAESQQLRRTLHDAPDLSYKKLTSGIKRLPSVWHRNVGLLTMLGERDIGNSDIGCYSSHRLGPNEIVEFLSSEWIVQDYCSPYLTPVCSEERQTTSEES